jgi:protein subunit release factor A
MSLIVEIRSGEGGKDAKLLVAEQYNFYLKLEGRGCL